jgi:phosphopantetheine--protein transferase-like protein
MLSVWPTDHPLDVVQRKHGIQVALCPVPADRAGQSAAVRACACELLRARGVNSPHIGRHANGAPIWPDGWVGSLTHSTGRGAVAVARADSIHAVGIDLEYPRRMKRALWAHVLTPTEINALADLPEDVANKRVTASFCAKEAIYKALSPLGGRVPGFHDVELVWDKGGGFTPRSTTAEAPAHLHNLIGITATHHEHILALTWLPSSPATPL